MTTKKKAPPPIKIIKTTHTRQVYTMQISAHAIRQNFNLPPDAEVSVTVPSGADWSGMELTIGDDVPHVTATWETNKEDIDEVED